jgi:hypothetical protein
MCMLRLSSRRGPSASTPATCYRQAALRLKHRLGRTRNFPPSKTGSHQYVLAISSHALPHEVCLSKISAGQSLLLWRDKHHMCNSTCWKSCCVDRNIISIIYKKLTRKVYVPIIKYGQKQHPALASAQQL